MSKRTFLQRKLSNCPYCPTDMATDIETSQYTAKTEVLRTEVSDKTEAIDNTTLDTQKTQVFGSGGSVIQLLPLKKQIFLALKKGLMLQKL